MASNVVISITIKDEVALSALQPVDINAILLILVSSVRIMYTLMASACKIIHACLDKMFSCETGLSNDSQASDQPDVAGRDVT